MTASTPPTTTEVTPALAVPEMEISSAPVMVPGLGLSMSRLRRMQSLPSQSWSTPSLQISPRGGWDTHIVLFSSAHCRVPAWQMPRAPLSQSSPTEKSSSLSPSQSLSRPSQSSALATLTGSHTVGPTWPPGQAVRPTEQTPSASGTWQGSPGVQSSAQKSRLWRKKPFTYSTSSRSTSPSLSGSASPQLGFVEGS